MASNASAEREQLHQLVDRLTPGQAQAVGNLIRTMLDPVARAVAGAPPDDEPVPAAQAHQLDQAREWLRQNSAIPHEQVLADLGVSL